MHTPVDPSFTIKVGCKGVFIARICLHDGMRIRHQGFATKLGSGLPPDEKSCSFEILKSV